MWIKWLQKAGIAAARMNMMHGAAVTWRKLFITAAILGLMTLSTVLLKDNEFINNRLDAAMSQNEKIYLTSQQTEYVIAAVEQCMHILNRTQPLNSIEPYLDFSSPSFVPDWEEMMSASRQPHKTYSFSLAGVKGIMVGFRFTLVKEGNEERITLERISFSRSSDVVFRIPHQEFEKRLQLLSIDPNANPFQERSLRSYRVPSEPPFQNSYLMIGYFQHNAAQQQHPVSLVIEIKRPENKEWDNIQLDDGDVHGIDMTVFG